MLTFQDITFSHSETSHAHLARQHMLTLWGIIWSHYETSCAHIEISYVDIIRLYYIIKHHMLLLCLTNTTK